MSARPSISNTRLPFENRHNAGHTPRLVLCVPIYRRRPCQRAHHSSCAAGTPRHCPCGMGTAGCAQKSCAAKTNADQKKIIGDLQMEDPYAASTIISDPLPPPPLMIYPPLTGYTRGQSPGEYNIICAREGGTDTGVEDRRQTRDSRLGIARARARPLLLFVCCCCGCCLWPVPISRRARRLTTTGDKNV